MTKRTIDAYVAAKFVNDNLITLKASGIIIDFENAMRASLKIVVPDLKIYGCWFHHVQALRRMMASMKDLFELVRKNKEAKEIFRKIQCLALLPENLILRAFTWLLREALEVHKFAEFSPFIQYYNNQWIKRVKPAYFSVFKRPTKTTASAEAFNGKSNKQFKTHGNFFNFVETLQREEAIKADQLDRDVKGIVQQDKRKRFYKQRSKLIEKYSNDLENNKLNYKQFINIMANVENNILFSEVSISLEDQEIVLSNENELIVGEDTNEISPVISERATPNMQSFTTHKLTVVLNRIDLNKYQETNKSAQIEDLPSNSSMEIITNETNEAITDDIFEGIQ